MSSPILGHHDYRSPLLLLISRSREIVRLQDLESGIKARWSVRVESVRLLGLWWLHLGWLWRRLLWSVGGRGCWVWRRRRRMLRVWFVMLAGLSMVMLAWIVVIVQIGHGKRR